jgi:hypothetical protein
MTELGIHTPRVMMRFNNCATTEAMETGAVSASQVIQPKFYNMSDNGVTVTPTLVDNGVKFTGNSTYKTGIFFGGYTKPLVSANPFQETQIRAQFILASSGVAWFGLCGGMYSSSNLHVPRIAIGIILHANQTCVCVTDQSSGIGDFDVAILRTLADNSEQLYLSPTYGAYDVSLYNTYELKIYIMQPNLELGGDVKIRVETFINGAIMDQSAFIVDDVNDYLALVKDGLRPYICQHHGSGWNNLYYVGVAR